MFTSLPRKYQAYVRIALASAWVFVALSGIGYSLASPIIIASPIGDTLGHVWGVVAFIAAIVAATGIAFNRYRLEWASAWFAASGLSVHTTILWWLVFTGDTLRLSQAAASSALVLFTITRALFCAAHASKLRTLHTGETGGIGVVQ